MRPTCVLAARCSALVALALVAGPALAAPRAFESPEAAAEAVVSALEAADRDALVEIFGPEGEDVILTGDDEEDRAAWGQFLRDYRTLNRIDVEDEAVATLSVGRDLWPFPVPLVAGETGWSFDAEAAREEIRLRRIGENELDVIDLMREYVRVQDVYRRMDPDGDGLPTFAAGILSNEGTRDGLYWAPEPDAPESPIGDFMARASADGYAVEGTDAEPDPYLGYYFRVLQRQGPSAPGGAMDYMINGRMVAGHALLAFPAAYGETGVMSFMVGEAGVVYEADLGEATLDTASEIDAFDPGPDWSPVAEG